MNSFQLKTGVVYTIDSGGVSVLNKENQKTEFISYPEAAVWLILNQKYSRDKSLELIKAILFDIEEDSIKLVNNCLENWKDSGLIK